MFLLKQFQNLIKIVSNRSEDINNYIDLIWMKWNVHPLLETVENLWFSVVFKVYRKEILPWIGLRFLCLEVFYKKAVLKNFAKFTGKYLCQSLFLNKVAGLRHPVLYDFAFFSYLLNFSLQWHLCKFLILGDLSTHLFGLVFPCRNPRKWGLGSTGLLPPWWDFLKLCFFKKIVKSFAEPLFIYICVYTSTDTLQATWPIFYVEESSKTSKYQILSEIVGFLKFVGHLQQPLWKRSQKNNFALHFTSYLSNALSTKSCPIQKQ